MKTVIKMPTKQLHQSPKGHKPHNTGTGHHDSRPNRKRTRSNANKAAIKDSMG